MKRIVTVVGARPQFVKAAAVSRALQEHGGLEERIVHTGQHYDPALSDVFFEELSIPRPAHHLEVGSGPHGKQTGQMLERIEAVLVQEQPAAVLVYGDTNSTLAGALAAAKLHVPIAHVEAGLRSYNRKMPEEVNRVLTDHVSALLLCPTHAAIENLRREGIEGGVHLVGDVMYDVALDMVTRAENQSQFRDRLPTKKFALATIHRAENTDDRARLDGILEALEEISTELPVVFPVHPRTRNIIGRRTGRADLRLIDPVGFLDMVWLEKHAALIVTDSGGVQKEAYFHRTPCVTVRTETEWVETVDAGWNRLANPSDRTAIVGAARAMLAGGRRGEIPEYGTGQAAREIARLVADIA